MYKEMLSAAGRLGKKAWLGGVRHGTIGGRKATRHFKRVGKDVYGFGKTFASKEGRKDVADFIKMYPKRHIAGAAAAGGIYGYATGEGTTGQRIERGLGFASVAGLGMSPGFRGAIAKQWKTADRAVGMYGVKKGLGAMGKRAVGGLGGTGRMAAAGALYGALDDDTSILGGAAIGAGGSILAKGAIRAQGRYIEKNPYVRHALGMPSKVEKSWLTMRHGAAAGGAVGLYAGGPVGMIAGAGLGATAGGIGRFAVRYPKAAAWGAGTALVGGMSTAIVAGAGMNAYQMHQNPRNTNYGADGDLTLGLHSLRHG